MTHQVKELAADASFLINLLATRSALELIDLAHLRLVLPTIAYTEVKRDREALDELIHGSRAVVVELPDGCAPHLVSAALAMDDGEAAVVALGMHRGSGFATDDGCAADYLTKVVGVPTERVVGIFDLIRKIASKLDNERLPDLLVRIRKDAKFAPPRQHAAWWSSIMGANK